MLNRLPDARCELYDYAPGLLEAQATRNCLSVMPLTPPCPVGVEGKPVETNTGSVSAEHADSGEVYGEF